MMHETGRKTDRRKVLKGVGMGALGVPLIGGSVAGKQAGCNLQVSVEAGEGGLDNWTQRSYLTDDFRGRIDVSGIRAGSEFAYMMIPTSPEGGFAAATTIRSDVVEASTSNESVVNQTKWNPSGIGPLGRWPEGRYNIYAVVADRAGEAFGVAISDSFEISP